MNMERFNTRIHENFRNKRGRIKIIADGKGYYDVYAEYVSGENQWCSVETNRKEAMKFARELARKLQLAFNPKVDLYT